MLTRIYHTATECDKSCFCHYFRKPDSTESKGGHFLNSSFSIVDHSNLPEKECIWWLRNDSINNSIMYIYTFFKNAYFSNHFSKNIFFI